MGSPLVPSRLSEIDAFRNVMWLLKRGLDLKQDTGSTGSPLNTRVFQTLFYITLLSGVMAANQKHTHRQTNTHTRLVCTLRAQWLGVMGGLKGMKKKQKCQKKKETTRDGKSQMLE